MLTSCTAAADRQYPHPAAASPPNAAEIARDQCLRTCEAFPTAQTDNSFTCRYEEALLAEDDVAHCDAAGPGGISACGGACAGYCNLMVAYCGHEDEGMSVEACMAECLTVPGRVLTNYVYPGPGPMSDTLHCRLAHASNAALQPTGSDLRNLHCNHAAGDADPCRDLTP